MIEEDFKIGAVGEHVVWNFLKNLSDSREIVDVRKDDFFQQADVDFLAEFKKGKFTWIEVKEDNKAHETGNIVWEEWSNYDYQTIGCFRKTKAQYIMYYLNMSKELFVIPTKRFRQYVDDNKYRWQLKDMGDHAKGYVIPVKELKDNKVIARTYTDVF